MPKVTFSARSAKGRVRNVSARPRLEQDEFRVAFADARWVIAKLGAPIWPAIPPVMHEASWRSLGASTD